MKETEKTDKETESTSNVAACLLYDVNTVKQNEESESSALSFSLSDAK